jgi:histidinol-phosphate aminotransferase
MNTVSRRDFGRFLGVGTIAATLPPLFAQNPPAPRSHGAGVRLSANENPYGPAASAMNAMRDAMRLVNRYPDDEVDELMETIAKLHGVSASHIILGDGSSEILKLTAAAFLGPARKVVMADPTFEALGHYARAIQADVVKVPLTSAYEHDLEKMAAVPGAGVIYLCNPNNPTASITSKQNVRAFLQSVPQNVMVLVDEAYFHYADSPDYESVIPLIQMRPNLIVARTFSKIYGMAGLRCGYGVAQPSVIEKMNQQKAWDSVNVIALAGARASLADTAHVTDGRKRNSETRNGVVSALMHLGYEVVPSQANFFMVNIKRPVKPVIDGIRAQGVHVGRLFPALPQYLRHDRNAAGDAGVPRRVSHCRHRMIV